ncbi:hypothetical protein J437_LFUL010394 [Ladona fulva]|uniref:long-chain-fatty-acid--CoA ligase n=1 Tax=Ladona fulva TaxID=123851 RepID=A0A8K0KCZ7_LADFU|nr:hypothetical protein J437_LFUL010394 [Ladona fulva]
MISLASFCAVAAILWYFFGWPSVVQLVIVAAVAYILTGKRYRFIYVVIRTAPRDLRALSRLIKLRWRMYKYRKNNLSVADMLGHYASKYPNRVAFIFEDKEWTFSQVEAYSNQVAAALKEKENLKPGDTVSLFMENRPEYVCIWLGLSKIGVITALINHNLRRQPLSHSVNIAASKVLIYGSELEEAVEEMRDSLEPNMKLYCWTGKTESMEPNANTEKSTRKIIHLDPLVSSASSANPSTEEAFKGGFDDCLMYIYTSGTTGLPKAAVITNSRYFFFCTAIFELVGLKGTDRLYTCLPLYHTAGGIGGIGQVLVNGCSMVLRRKFSASSYFKEAKKYNCTVGQYIGEMCRYMLSTPPHPDDSTHSVRTVYGNGLRPQIWSQFVERFNISHVGEFYGATEGNANIANIDDKVGAIGFISRTAPFVYPISIVRADPATGDPIRNDKGLCTVCGPGKYYLNFTLLIIDVFKKGDAAFISGDILVMDEFGYLFFKDRTGDTFRWKGENVSTSEVEAVISNVIGYRDAVAYGVEIRGQEGRAGMVAILDKDKTLDLVAMYEAIQKSLPSYARPIFIRVLTELDMTGTYKLKKVDLQKEGFDPMTIKDNLYYQAASGKYEPINPDVYDQIQNGKIRL